MMNTTGVQLDSAALMAFAATLGHLPPDEVERAKVLYVKNALTDYHTACASMRGMMIVFIVLSIIPLFWLVTIPGLLGMRAARRNLREKIANAIQVWGLDCDKWQITL
jgi:hypothetical protein